PFLESLNWAAVYQLPVLFVCEDNKFSATTSTAGLTAGPGVAARALALGVPGESADGNDVEAVHAAAGRLVGKIRAGEGPQLLHALTWRVRGHVSVDKQAYRDPNDLQGAIDADPLRRARTRALERGIGAAELDAIDAAVQAE